MRGGEDYELLFSAPPKVIADVQRRAQTSGASVTVIGQVMAPDPGLPLVTVRLRDGELIGAEAGAFDHFR
jgi:thiamine-monophosphate kinase